MINSKWESALSIKRGHRQSCFPDTLRMSLVIAAIVCTGCNARKRAGDSFDLLKPGMTTEEVAACMGDPTSRNKEGKGFEWLTDPGKKCTISSPPEFSKPSSGSADSKSTSSAPDSKSASTTNKKTSWLYGPYESEVGPTTGSFEIELTFRDDELVSARKVKIDASMVDSLLKKKHK